GVELAGALDRLNLDRLNGFDAVVGAVRHRLYCELDAAALAALLRRGGLVADIKGMWRHLALPQSVRRWQL
ncbi:MAG TPA: hypothetical protein VE631_02145, partial [Alphaproteobacteria bacterium]|nr:hypothetical protein [Alphaproteobacteria bacterium]